VKLPTLSADELRSLYASSSERNELSELVHQIRSSLVSGLRPYVQVIVGDAIVKAPLPVQALQADPPILYADNDLLVAWVAARFGSNCVCHDVPAHYGESLLAKIRLALAETVLRRRLTGASTRCLEIKVDGQLGMLALDWTGMSSKTLTDWAVRQWTSAR
jgi:hypothetical protein